jgi:hypothetical protein
LRRQVVDETVVHRHLEPQRLAAAEDVARAVGPDGDAGDLGDGNVVEPRAAADVLGVERARAEVFLREVRRLKQAELDDEERRPGVFRR